MGYLDNSGLSYLWGKIKTALGGKQDKESSVSVPGSGALSMSETLGSGPYTIEFTEEAGSGGGSLPDGSAGQILGYVEDNVVGPIMSKRDLLSDETAEALGLAKEITVDLSAVKKGDVIKLKEGNHWADFICVPDYESELNGAGRVLLVRSGGYDFVSNFAASNGEYAESTVDAACQSYKANLTAEVQAAILPTKFRYTASGNTTAVSTLTRDVFVLSVTEIYGPLNYTNQEGTFLDLPVNALKYGFAQWTRTPRNNSAGSAHLYYLGAATNEYTNTIRVTDAAVSNGGGTFAPCFSLPASFPAYSYYEDDYGNVYDDAPGAPTPDLAFQMLYQLTSAKCKVLNKFVTNGVNDPIFVLGPGIDFFKRHWLVIKQNASATKDYSSLNIFFNGSYSIQSRSVISSSSTSITQPNSNDVAVGSEPMIISVRLFSPGERVRNGCMEWSDATTAAHHYYSFSANTQAIYSRAESIGLYGTKYLGIGTEIFFCEEL